MNEEEDGLLPLGADMCTFRLVEGDTPKIIAKLVIRGLLELRHSYLPLHLEMSAEDFRPIHCRCGVMCYGP